MIVSRKWVVVCLWIVGWGGKINVGILVGLGLKNMDWWGLLGKWVMGCFIRLLGLIVWMYKLGCSGNKRVMVVVGWYVEKNGKGDICFLYKKLWVGYLVCVGYWYLVDGEYWWGVEVDRYIKCGYILGLWVGSFRI